MASDHLSARPWTSLLLASHVCCVAIVLSANLSPSPMQAKLVAFVAPYARPLNLDPNFTPYYLTLGREQDDDFRIEIAPAGSAGPSATPQPNTSSVAADAPAGLSKTSTWLPDVGIRGSQRRRRYQLLASRIAFFANHELDATTAEFVRAIGTYAIAWSGGGRFVVRCWLHQARLLESEGAMPDDPHDPIYFQEIYAADVWLDPDGEVQLLKRSSARDSSPAVLQSERRP